MASCRSRSEARGGRELSKALLSKEKPQLASLGNAQPLQRPNEANVKKWHGLKMKPRARRGLVWKIPKDQRRGLRAYSAAFRPFKGCRVSLANGPHEAVSPPGRGRVLTLVISAAAQSEKGSSLRELWARLPSDGVNSGKTHNTPTMLLKGLHAQKYHQLGLKCKNQNEAFGFPKFY